MTEKIKELFRPFLKTKPYHPPTRVGVCHYVVGPYLYARQYVVEKWGGRFLYYFSCSKAFIPLTSTTVCFMTPRNLTYKKVLEMVKKNRIDVLAVEEEILKQIGFMPKLPPVEEFIIVSQTEKKEIKEEFPISTLHKVEVKESVTVL